MEASRDQFDTARCRARIAEMRDEELDEYILRIKARLVHSRADSYFMEESLLLQLGEACEELRRRQSVEHSKSSRELQYQPRGAHQGASHAAD